MRRVRLSGRQHQQPVRFERLEDRQLFSTLMVGGPKAPFQTIQAAVNAAHPGDKINIQAGTYSEQVTIPSNLPNLTLQGAGEKTFIQAPPNMTGSGAIIFVQADNTQIQNLTVQGPAASLGDSLLYGILDTGAANLQVQNCSVLDIQEQAANASDAVGTAIRINGGGSGQIQNCTVADYQKSGIVINDAGSMGQIQNDTITGQGPISTIAQNGVEFDNGAGGTIQNCDVSGNVFSPQTIEDAGILLFNSSQVTVQNNKVSDNDGDIILSGPDRIITSPADAANVTNYAEGSSVLKNKCSGATYDGISLFDGTNSATIQNNKCNGNGGDGLLVYTQDGGTPQGNDIENNDLSGNGNYDLEDQTFDMPGLFVGTDGTANVYQKNKVKTSNDPMLTK